MTTFLGTMRAYPYIVLLSMLTFGLVFRNILFIYFGAFLFINIWVNKLLKYILSKVMGDKDYPLIGKGTRPTAADGCGYFYEMKVGPNEGPNKGPNEGLDRPSTGSASYGMPSGHA